jgi:5-methylcytosine-specific restriction endonuclease McrA
MPAKNRPDLKTADWKTLRIAILERDAHTCAYCGAEADTVDHIIPASMGGTADPSNLIAACNRCNGTKSNKIHARTNWVNTRWGVRLS